VNEKRKTKLCEAEEEWGRWECTDEDIPVGILGSIVGHRIRRNCNAQTWNELGDSREKGSRQGQEVDSTPRSRLISQMVTAPGGGKLGIVVVLRRRAAAGVPRRRTG
jgi:hypothetical protein